MSLVLFCLTRIARKASYLACLMLFAVLSCVAISENLCALDELHDDFAMLIASERKEPVQVSPDNTTAVALRGFEDLFLKGTDGADRLLSNLFDTAQLSGVLLEDGDYRYREDSAGGWGTYEITLPVKGSEATIRSFAAQALKNNPALSLVSIRFARARISDGEIEARMVFNQYYRTIE